MPTMSGPINPIDPGYGAIFLSGSRIFMSNSLGELYDLTDSKGYLNVVIITGSSNSGWSKPGGLAYAHVICVGGAGGGAGGRQGAASTIRGGGGAGAGASINQIWFNTDQLPNGPYTTSIALPAAGGLGATAINTNGQNGNNGNFSFFMKDGIVYAAAGGTLSGGGAPRGGNSLAGGGGNIVVGFVADGSVPAGGTGQMINSPLPSPLYSFGNNAPNGFPTTVGNAANFPARGAGYNAAGGGGGGITAGNVTSVGGSGSAPIVNGSPAFSGAPTVAGVGGAASNGADNVYDFLQVIGFTSSVSCSFGLGGGGHGGGSGDLAGTVAGSDGGNGGLYGAGGGAGGGSTNGARGGNGGSGSGGCIVIVEYY